LTDEITYVGHATTLVELDGTRLLTDPLLRRRVLHLRRRDDVPLPSISPRPDAVLLSHAHPDHLDPPSLRKVATDCPMIAPLGLARFLRRHGFEKIVELRVGERTRIGSLEVTAVTAAHDGRRYPIGRRLEALGFVIDGSASVYFAGDTDLFPGMARLAKRLDLALLPVWGWGPRVGRGHLDPERAADAVAMMRPRNAVPIHWGTLAGPGSGRRAGSAEPAEAFKRLAAKVAPEVRVWVLRPGASLSFAEMATAAEPA
jgi:L-ascorbate metabolism protein UlaG (beta-lactamase superfamily)